MAWLETSAWIFIGVGILLVLLPPAITNSRKEKQTKEVFLMNSFVPMIMGLLCLMFGFWAILKDAGSENESNWQSLTILTAGGAAACSIIAAYQSMVLIRWRAD